MPDMSAHHWGHLGLKAGLGKQYELGIPLAAIKQSECPSYKHNHNHCDEPIWAGTRTLPGALVGRRH